jgi:hypothetical protein
MKFKVQKQNRSLTNMSYNAFKFTLILMMSVIFLVPDSRAEGDKNEKGKALQKINTQVAITSLNINNISTYFYNNGISDISSLGNSGLVYPKGSGKTAVFTSGLLWGAKVPGDPDPRVGGTAYRTGLQPGKVLSNGTADDPNLDKYRIYRVRRDVYPGGPVVDLSTEVSVDGLSESEIRSQYELDWTEWPVSMGAPYFDGNNNGQYDPDPTTGDIPGVPGADQTLWFVANDLNSGITTYLYGANPLGIECQTTIWAYNQAGALGSTYFRKYKLINITDRTANPTTFEDMYFSMFSDVDLGDAGDDYVGVDVDLSLQFCYNASANDATYSPLPPPAVGFDFFQGPVVTGVAGQDINQNGIDDALDYAIFDGKKVGPGKVNMPMTAAYYFANGDPNIGDPPQNDPDGSKEFYNFFQGKFGISGAPFIDLSTGLPTTYALSGDPQAGTGWLDGFQLPAGDRRQGSASGPFNMAPGDTQEVVVAELVAGAIQGVDRLSAVGLLKFYDQQAQVAYDNFFDLPVAPPAPVVSVTELDQEIILDWSKDAASILATESFNSKGYSFQGYNVYQLPSASSLVSDGIRIATYDIIDQVGKIQDLVFDVKTGSVIKVPVQFGNDTGIKRFLSIKNDVVRGGVPLVNGRKYYFAVTSYNFNPSLTAVPNNLENPIAIIEVIPQTPNPGVTYSDESGGDVDVTHSGTADGLTTVKIVDPAATLGHNYEVFFTDRQEIRDANGDWIAASVVNRKMGPDTLTGTSIEVAALYGATPGQVELSFYLDLVSVDFDWADGITLTFPPNVAILDAPSFEAGGGTIIPDVQGNVINMGLVEGQLTGDGIFHGGEEWSILVNAELPISIDWIVYDDGYGGGPVDATGTTVVSTIGSKSRLAKYWNLRDVTTSQVKLENQSVVAGIDLYPKRDDQVTYNYSPSADPTVDGFQVGVDIGYEAPVTISANNPPTVNGDAVFSFSGSQVWWDSDNYNVCDFQRFGYADGFANTSLPVYGGAGGTLDINVLQQDLEFRFTGVLGDTVINGDTLTITKSGGSIATLFGASGYSLADHPLNPNPGVDQSIAIRIPFEVWNVDANQQVNLVIWDRQGNPTVNGGSVWLQTNRVYTWVVNTPYSPSVIDVTSQSVADNASWNVVFYRSLHTVGDVVRINYDNPIQIGVDTYNFSTKGVSFSNELAKQQVDKINVFPNPYYGVNSEELNKYNRFVTFSHLPAKATVRIFNLAGVFIKTIQKDDPGQFLRWDLANESGLPVASGLYIAYIELPDLGETKIVKVAVIQEQQILDRF